MKVLAVTIKIRKNKVDEAKRFFKTFVGPSRAEKGCIQYDLFQSSEDPQIFYFFEKWESDLAFEEHSSQSFLKDFKNRYEELLEEPNKRFWLNIIE